MPKIGGNLVICKGNMNKEKLSNLYDIGSSKRVFQSEWREKGVPFYRAREIARLSEDGYVDNELFIDEDLYEEYTEKYGRPQPGDVMVTGVGTLGVCYVVKPRDKFYFKDGNILWFKQKAPDRIMPEYLVKAFESKEVKDFISKNSSGTTVGTFTIQTANRMEITLPSIDQQEQIIERISKLESIIKKRQNELVKLDELIKARFVEMFGGEKNLMAMSDICSIITDGTHQPPKFKEDGIPFIFVSNITSDKLTYEAEKFIDQDTYNELVKRTPIEIGDVLLSTVGSYGHPAVVKSDKKFLFQRHIAYLKPKKEIVDSDYLHGAILSPGAQRQIEQGVKGIAQKTLNLSEIKKMRIPIPNMDKQKEFATFVAQVDKSKSRKELNYKTKKILAS